MNATTALGPIGQISRSVRDIQEAQAGHAVPESILHLRVADIAAAHENLRSRGVEFTNAPHMIHPEGRTLAIMSQEAK